MASRGDEPFNRSLTPRDPTPFRARRYLNYDGFISFAADFRIAPPSPDKAVVVARPLVAQAKAAAEKGDAGAEMDLQAKAAALMSPHDCLMTAEQLRVIFTLSAFTCTRPELAVFALDDPSLLASNVPAEPVAAPSPGSPTKQGADSKTQPLEDDLELARKSEAVNRGLTFDQANCALAPRAPRTTSARSLPRASNARRSSSIASVGARSSRSRRATFTPTTAARASWYVRARAQYFTLAPSRQHLPRSVAQEGLLLDHMQLDDADTWKPRCSSHAPPAVYEGYAPKKEEKGASKRPGGLPGVKTPAPR